MKKASSLPATWLVGDKTRLRPLEPQDVPRFRRYKLAIDPKAMGYIVQTSEGRDIGALGLSILGPHAAIAIAFGERRRFGDGSAADALRVMCAGAFRSQPLVRIEALVPSNAAAQLVAFHRAGFKDEGVLRSALRIRGAYRDAVVLSILNDE